VGGRKRFKCPSCGARLPGRFEHVAVVEGTAARMYVDCEAWAEETERVYWFPSYLAREGRSQPENST
jgi:hypothetical protein